MFATKGIAKGGEPLAGFGAALRCPHTPLPAVAGGKREKWKAL